MIVHLVLFRFADSVDDRSPAENAASLVEQLNALNGVVPSLRRLTAGINLIPGEDVYQVGLESLFDDAEGLEAYRVHPAHQKVVDFVKRTTSARTAVDYEIA